MSQIRLLGVVCSFPSSPATMAVCILVQNNATSNFNEDPPSDFEADYEEDRMEYNEAVQDYMNAVNEATEINQVAEDLTRLVRLSCVPVPHTYTTVYTVYSHYMQLCHCVVALIQ